MVWGGGGFPPPHSTSFKANAMLGRILMEMNNSPEPLTVSEISRRLGIDRSALEGMLETLVRLGKLEEGSVREAGCGYGGA